MSWNSSLMKKLLHALLAFSLCCCTCSLAAQTLSLKLLPAKAQKALKDFVAIEGGAYTTGLFLGYDSLQCTLSKNIELESFYLQRFELSNAEYRVFMGETGDMANHYDSLSWQTDYPASFNGSMVQNYFWHPNFQQYPIVGISWEQAVRYCAWKTEQLNQLLTKTPYRVTVRLPSASEWEYAALGLLPPQQEKKDQPNYPWNGFFFPPEKDGHLSIRCNSGPIQTLEQVKLFEFPSDGFLYTAPVKSFQPNAFGLYQMAGNVAEWTSDSYSTIRERYKIALDKYEDGEKINPEFLKQVNELAPAEPYQDYKIIKGGSWFDGPFYMQAGVVKIQHPAKVTCTTGFRPALVIEKK